MQNLTRRQQFYQGQKVVPEDLNTLQDYADKTANNLALDVLGYGIVQGFKLSVLQGFTIEVSAGSAFNQKGERLILSAGVPIDFSHLRPTSGQDTIKLGIKKKYLGSNTVLDTFGKSIDTILTPSVEFISGVNLANDVFELAELTLNALGIKTILKTASKLMTIPQQVNKTLAFSTEQASESTTANIDADILNLNADININTRTLQDTIRDLIYPISTTYTQYTNKLSHEFLDTEAPALLFGGAWELLSMELKNNIPEIVSNYAGTAYKYPDGKLEFVSLTLTKYYSGYKYPVSFISTPSLYPFAISKNGEQPLSQTGENLNYGMTSTYTSFTTNYHSGAKNYMFVKSTGFWKAPEAPITTAEERNYVKIWQRIA